MTATEEARQRLREAAWLKKAAPFFDILDGAEGATRVVGGLVRDTLLGLERSNSDIDMASVFEPSEIMARAKRAGIAVHPTGVEHGTVTLVAKGVAAEVTTLRQDVETFGRHARVKFGTDWEADARRRDFTMNALYCGPDGELFDPISGLADCLERRVRFIGDADARIAEDRLRVYRYFRFCATHGREQFDGGALVACQRAATRLDQLSAERIGAEMLKLLNAPTCLVTLEHMTEIGIVGDDLIPLAAFPALRRLEAESGAGSVVMRIALMVYTGASLDELQTRWRLSNALCKSVMALKSGAELAIGGQVGELAYRYPDIRHAAVLLAGALADWPGEQVSVARRQAAALSPGAFPVRGQDLLEAGVPKGKAMGEAKRQLERDWIESGFTLDRQALLARLP